MSKETFREAETLNNRSLSDFLTVSLVSPSFHGLNRHQFKVDSLPTRSLSSSFESKDRLKWERSTWVGCKSKTVEGFWFLNLYSSSIFFVTFFESHKFWSGMRFHLDFVRLAVCMMCEKFRNKNLSASSVLLTFC